MTVQQGKEHVTVPFAWRGRSAAEAFTAGFQTGMVIARMEADQKRVHVVEVLPRECLGAVRGAAVALGYRMENTPVNGGAGYRVRLVRRMGGV